MVIRRKGFILAELPLALGIVALVGLTVAFLVGRGSRGTAQAGEAQLATVVGARLVDEVLTLTYGELLEHALAARRLHLTETGPIMMDGIPFDAHVRFEEPDAGLVLLELDLSWKGSSPGREGDGISRLRLKRLVADPLIAVGGTEP